MLTWRTRFAWLSFACAGAMSACLLSIDDQLTDGSDGGAGDDGATGPVDGTVGPVDGGGGDAPMDAGDGGDGAFIIVREGGASCGQPVDLGDLGAYDGGRVEDFGTIAADFNPLAFSSCGGTGGRRIYRLTTSTSGALEATATALSGTLVPVVSLQHACSGPEAGVELDCASAGDAGERRASLAYLLPSLPAGLWTLEVLGNPTESGSYRLDLKWTKFPF